MINAVAIEITKSIYEGKWLSIRYHNKNEEETYFWCGIKDIDTDKRMILADVYNIGKEGFKADFKMYIDSIKQANVVEGTFYGKQEALIEKMKNNVEDFLFLELRSLDDRVLNYYLECYANDDEPYQNEYTLVKGLDLNIFKSNRVELSDHDFDHFVNILNKQLKLKVDPKTMLTVKLVINYLSIYQGDDKIIPLVYYNTKLDIEHKCLIVDDKPTINKNQISDGKQQAYISNYIDVDYKFFKENFLQYEQEFTEQVRKNLGPHEKLDQMPYIFKISLRYNTSLRSEFEQIESKYKANKLNKPLSSFFGLIEKDTKRTKVRPLLIDNSNINVNQLRAVYNAINRNVVFIQGPPGTGKTVSIVNMVHSCLFNNESTLITSNNNEAINNIVSKLSNLSFNNVPIRYPFLRLGSDENIQMTLRNLSDNLKYFELIKFTDEDKERLYDLEYEVNENMKYVNEILEKYETRLELEQKINGLQNFIKLIEEDNEIDEFTKEGNKIDFEAQIFRHSEKLKQTIDKSELENLKLDSSHSYEIIYYLSLEYGKKLFDEKYSRLREILNIQDEVVRLKEFKSYIISDDGIKRLLECFPIILSTNVSSSKLGTSNSSFDLLIMEEASQCGNAVSLIPMSRCKRACFIGDQNQLQPVITLTDELNNKFKNTYNIPDSYDYKQNSVLTTLLKIDTASKFIMLEKHYRCPKKVINFANKKYYKNLLDIENLINDDSSLKLIDIQNTSSYEPNTSGAEISAILEELRTLPKNEEVAIITPFKKQARLIESVLFEKGIENIKVGTIHTFQGQEKDHIIVSTAVTGKTKQGSFDWIKNNKELINVMTTRPKKKLTIIADVQAIDKLSQGEANDYFELINYMALKGDSEIIEVEEDMFSSRANGYRNFTTKSERELLKTVQHFRSTNQKFGIRLKPKIIDVLDLLPEENYLFNYANSAHFDLLLTDNQDRPLMAIEVCGPEHYEDPIVMARDKKKAEICALRNLHLVIIPNENVRKYNEIRQIIIDTLKS